MKHACNLGGLLAAQIAHMAKVKAYIADPPVVDEMDDVSPQSQECPSVRGSRSSMLSTKKPSPGYTVDVKESTMKKPT